MWAHTMYISAHLFEMSSNFDENVAFMQSVNESVGHGVEAYQIGYHEDS